MPETSPPCPELLTMLLADARLPVAGHTQSAGLEPAVAAGMTAADVPEYVATRLATVTRVEAATAVVALHHLRSGLPLAGVELAWAARTPSAAMRRTARTQGRALLRLLSQLVPETAALLCTGVGCRAIVLATAAHVFGLTPVALARLIGYDDVQTVTCAALKLIPLDPAMTTQWAYDALPAVESLAREVSTLTRPEQIPAAGAPQIEAWAEAHAVAKWRLFSA